MNSITIANLVRRVPELVGERPDARWQRASLTLRGSDGISREEFFGLSAKRRIGRIHDRIVTRAPWGTLTQLDIPKRHARGQTRPICWATVADTALLYLLTDALSAYAETVLSDVAIAYRPHRAIDQSIRRAIQEMRSRSLYCVSVLDIQSFYDSIPWSRLDAVIERVPADSDVHILFKQLVRVRVRKLDGTLVRRQRGIPQGLPLSPVLANLALAHFDRAARAKLARRGVIIRRYADDILVAAPDRSSLERARRFVVSQLRWQGLDVKAGTGESVDLREAGARVRWLGIELSTVELGGLGGQHALALGVSPATITEKADEIIAELETRLIHLEEVRARLDALERFYSAILAGTAVQEIIQSIWDLILPTNTSQTPRQMMLTWTRRLGLQNARKEVSKTIENVIHRSHPVTTNRIPFMGHPLDDGTDDRMHAFSLSLKEETSETKKWTTGITYASFAPLWRKRDDSRHDGTKLAFAAINQQSRLLQKLQLPPPAGLRCPMAERSGAPARSRPGRSLETGRAHVWAVARGPKSVEVTVRGPTAWSDVLPVPDSRSTAEAVLAGFELAVRCLVADGFDDVTLDTDEPVIGGYVRRGWRVRSFRLLARLRAIQALGTHVAFANSPEAFPDPLLTLPV